MLNEASRVLYNAMDEKVYFSDAIVVVPPDWSNSKCKEQIQTPMSDLVFRVRLLQFKTMYYLYIGMGAFKYYVSIFLGLFDSPSPPYEHS